MKKFIIATAVIFVVASAAVYVLFGTSWVVGPGNVQATTSVKQVGKTIQIDKGNGWEDFEIKGVDLGAGIPGHYATEYAIDKETYLRWFQQIKDMGANTIRVYITLGPAFYEAFYEFNNENPDPLYLIHGVWIDDYVQNSHMDAFNSAYQQQFIEDCRTVVDVIHGQRWVNLGSNSANGSYTRDVSPWVIGYILGVEWEAPTVAYTDETYVGMGTYEGEYLHTTTEASAFENMLASVGDALLTYENNRYAQQRLVAFSNWPTTDPFDYPKGIETFFEKYSSVDVEHIKFNEHAIAGTFASYHVYPYYPDYLQYMPEYATQTDPTGQVNTYYTYLKRLVEYHSMPVVVSEYGVPSARGAAQRDANTDRHQGNMSETDQGNAIVRCYEDIMAAGCAGSVVFTWQDEWFKRTWNTMANVDLTATPYWGDYQTNEQYFGLLSFDPGTERSVSYVDGNAEEWQESDVIGEYEGNALSMKYDEKFLYFMVKGADVAAAQSGAQPLYLPIDTTQKTGSTTISNLGALSDLPLVGAAAADTLEFQRAADFVLMLQGEANSRVVVQERYEVMRAMQLRATTGQDPYTNPPAQDSSTFKHIDLVLQTLTDTSEITNANQSERRTEKDQFYYQTYETGKLTYGNANPESDDFNSLADYCYGVAEDGTPFVEVKLPWQLLNFSNPSEMMIHDDYYEHYGVENMHIGEMYVGVGTGQTTIPLFTEKLEGWGSKVTYHERLKESYYILQELWAGESMTTSSAAGQGGDAQ